MATKKSTTASRSSKSGAATNAKAPAKGKAAAQSSKAKTSTSTKKSTAKTSTSTKKSTAKTSTSTKKSTAKTSPARTSTTKSGSAPRRPAKKKAKSPFNVRDRVVYPHHGAAIIRKKEQRVVDGEKVDYFVIEAITNPLTLRIPVDSAVELGLRPVISKNAARKVFAILKEDPVEADATWARWFKLLQDKMSSGDIYEVATVVRDLTYAQQAKPLGPALKRMLAKARLILTSELQLALDIDEESAEKRLDRALAHLIVEPEEEE
jgi:CarD family transcriptional regulator